MGFSEFREYDDPLSEDYDIKSSLRGEDSASSTNLGDYYIDVSYFGDGLIDYTKKHYMYNYKRLLALLLNTNCFLEMPDILDKCGISEEEFKNPDEETFERIRQYVVNGVQSHK